MTSVDAFAPAKINLALHVTGQRADGFHLLDSLVMLANVGDHIRVEKARETVLSVEGPMAAGVPTDRRNLVVKAAEMLGVSAKITLEKHLPAAAGIGGGSSDAAAAIRALTTLYNMPVPSAARLVELGADVPVCMSAGLTRMQGIGEDVTLLGDTPNWFMILANPRVDVPTGAVFGAMKSKQNSAMQLPTNWQERPQDDVSWLASLRNDMQAAAVTQQPVINDVLAALRNTTGNQMVRMSGSGATCFAIYATDTARDQALAQLKRSHPTWWLVGCERCGVEFR